MTYFCYFKYDFKPNFYTITCLDGSNMNQGGAMCVYIATDENSKSSSTTMLTPTVSSNEPDYDETTTMSSKATSKGPSSSKKTTKQPMDTSTIILILLLMLILLLAPCTLKGLCFYYGRLNPRSPNTNNRELEVNPELPECFVDPDQAAERLNAIGVSDIAEFSEIALYDDTSGQWTYVKKGTERTTL
ncbi:hypothetical protein B566_EDAN004194 [Ephemera danica]|nr:hypothetical protein B566_EDAN004194 [Ephemera danica]